MKRRGLWILPICFSVVLTAGPIRAQDEDAWRGYAVLYTGIAQTNGTNTKGSVTYDVDSRSGDLQWTTGLMTGAFKGRWGGQVEVNWMSASHDDQVYSDGTITINGGLDVSHLAIEAEAFFLALGTEARRLDIMVGARSYRMSNDWSITSNQTQFGSIDAGGGITESWVDPLIAVRFAGNMDEQFWGSVRAEAGGFDVGSRFTWGLRAEAGLRYKQTDWMLGIRHYDIDYDNGESGDAYFAQDARHNQFLLLVGFRFS